MLAKYRCNLCGEVFSNGSRSPKPASKILDICIGMKEGTNSSATAFAYTKHETDTHIGIAELIGFEYEESDTEEEACCGICVYYDPGENGSSWGNCRVKKKELHSSSEPCGIYINLEKEKRGK